MGIATRNTTESLRLMSTAISVAPIIMKGARKPSRMIIMNAFCRLVTSVVSRVISEAVEKWSILENEKSCTRSNRALRTFRENPVLAFAEYLPAIAPKKSETTAIATINPPMLTV